VAFAAGGGIRCTEKTLGPSNEGMAKTARLCHERDDDGDADGAFRADRFMSFSRRRSFTS
jgi:hypothetical protein